ncbi:MAG: GNAT family N-acetyltransferase [Thalassospira sp.]|uniref:GNAT family N-acetyltransferase n=1 Tax=Thalassospira sp. TaxID=1912094 RepID=UPI003A8986D6
MTIEHRCRKQINKAIRNDLRAEIVTPDKKLLDVYYNLHLQTCRRNGIKPHPNQYFRTIQSTVAPAGLSKSCVVMLDNEVLAIHNFLIYKNCALYWTTAGSKKALQLCANDLGIWHAIKELKQIGISYLDCGEAFPGIPHGKLKGLNDFKKSFGGELHPYFRGQTVYRPITESIMSIARHLLSRGATH